MSKKIWTRESLISLFLELQVEIGSQPTKNFWKSDARTPSDMPIRMNFGNWRNFVLACGGVLREPEISALARQNCIKSRIGQIGGNYRSGRFTDKCGYVQIWMPQHPNARLGGYIHEHRLVISNSVGRPLHSFETVHHKNGDRSDNRIENLELWSSVQPSGQRVEDKLKYAYEIIRLYGNIYPELLQP